MFSIQGCLQWFGETKQACEKFSLCNSCQFKRWIENSIYKEFPFLPAFATTKWQEIDCVQVWMFAHI